MASYRLYTSLFATSRSLFTGLLSSHVVGPSVDHATTQKLKVAITKVTNSAWHGLRASIRLDFGSERLDSA